MMSGLAVAGALVRDGFSIVPQVLDHGSIERARCGLAKLVGEGHAVRHLDRRMPELIEGLRAALMTILMPLLDQRPVVLDATLFRKPPTANWKVPWHQDLQVAARVRVDVDGWGPWSKKDGLWHVQPPVAVLERLLAVRIHLSDCGPEDGPLRLLPGSHRSGIQPAGGFVDLGTRPEEVVVTAVAGDVLLMRPLTLHASQIAQGRSDRMVVHLLLGAAEDLRGTPLVER